MRVLIASKLNTQQSYGGSNRALHLGRYLAEKVDVFHVGLNCSSVDYAPSRSTGSPAVGAFVREIKRAIHDFDPDVVFSAESRANLACRLLRLSDHRPRWVIGFDSSPAFEWKSYLDSSQLPRLRGTARYVLSRTIERIILSSGAPVVVVSNFLRNLVREWYGVTPGRLHVVSNGAPPDLPERRPSAVSPYRGSDEGARIALLIAPRHFFSNVLAVRFAHEVAERLEVLNPDIRIVIVGGGPVLGAAPNVRYVGYVDDVVPYIDFADVCLLPYPPDAVCGGARLKAMEYLARGKPVLSTSEGVRGIDGLRDGVEVVIAPANPEDFARALYDLIRDRSRHATLAPAGRDFVALHHDWRLLAQQLLGIFERSHARQ